MATVHALSLLALVAAGEPSRTCGEITGDTARLRLFCERTIPLGTVELAQASGSVLTLAVTRTMANQMQRDSLTTEALILRWMALWKTYSRSRSVTVIIRWAGVELARGQTTTFAGDRVTLRGR